MIVATICKTTFGFGQPHFINDWATRDGYILSMMLLGGLTTGISLQGVVVF